MLAQLCQFASMYSFTGFHHRHCRIHRAHPPGGPGGRHTRSLSCMLGVVLDARARRPQTVGFSPLRNVGRFRAPHIAAAGECPASPAAARPIRRLCRICFDAASTTPSPTPGVRSIKVWATGPFVRRPLPTKIGPRRTLLSRTPGRCGDVSKPFATALTPSKRKTCAVATSLAG